MSELLKAGQFVRVTDVRSLAYGRVAVVLMTNKGRSQVRFADLPKVVSGLTNPKGFVETFSNADLTAVGNFPIAASYLLVTIFERNGGQEYTHYCLAHGEAGQQMEQIAESVAQNWYSDGGEWDENESAYRFKSESYLIAFAQDWEEISVAEYIRLRNVLTDCTPGYIGPTDGEDTEAEYIRRQTRGL
ncbi:hypothetical protein [Nodosilinea nodulosa]|uniref:hypothetical protein n=1 Tax=Nodosilinea nodulosa TaxID=416001 RepID=UPI000306BC3D|nr:hypothetical protein [Nodosilinea nodulosa]